MKPAIEEATAKPKNIGIIRTIGPSTNPEKVPTITSLTSGMATAGKGALLAAARATVAAVAAAAIAEAGCFEPDCDPALMSTSGVRRARSGPAEMECTRGKRERGGGEAAAFVTVLYTMSATCINTSKAGRMPNELRETLDVFAMMEL